MTIAEQLSDEGLRDGRAEGERTLLLKQLALKVGVLNPSVRARVAAATLEKLERWAVHIPNRRTARGNLRRSVRWWSSSVLSERTTQLRPPPRQVFTTGVNLVPRSGFRFTPGVNLVPRSGFRLTPGVNLVPRSGFRFTPGVNLVPRSGFRFTPGVNLVPRSGFRFTPTVVQTGWRLRSTSARPRVLPRPRPVQVLLIDSASSFVKLVPLSRATDRSRSHLLHSGTRMTRRPEPRCTL